MNEYDSKQFNYMKWYELKKFRQDFSLIHLNGNFNSKIKADIKIAFSLEAKAEWRKVIASKHYSI